MDDRVTRMSLLSGLVALSCYLAFEDGRGIVFAAVGLCSALAVLAGVRLRGIGWRNSWQLVAVCQFCFFAGDLILLSPQRSPSPADGLYFAAYAALIAAVSLFAWRRAPTRHRGALTDAAIISTSIAVPAWAFLMAPNMADPLLSSGELLVSTSYPLFDVLLLAISLRLVLISGRRPVSLLLLVSALGSLLVGDVVRSVTLLQGSPDPPLATLVLWLSYNVLVAAAALHPSMPELTRAAPVREERLPRWRLTLLVATSLVAPGTTLPFLLSDRAPSVVTVTVIIGGSLMLTLLLTYRITMERRRAEQTLALQRTYATLLQDVGVAATHAATVEEALQAAVDITCTKASWSVGHVALADVGGGLAPSAIWHLNDPARYLPLRQATEATTSPLERDTTGKVLVDRKPAWSADLTEEDPRTRAGIATALGIRSQVAFPVLLGDEVVAVLEFFSTDAREPDSDLLGSMMDVGNQLSWVYERKRAEMVLAEQAVALSHQATHDPLTGLLNRRGFRERLEEALADGEQAQATAVLFIDIDDFKDINDSLGHSAGDYLLTVLAERLCSCVRTDDVVGRLGGDDFGVLLRGFAAPDVVALAQRIKELVHQTDLISSLRRSTSLSIGIASSPGHGDTAEALLRNADLAMRAAKGKGKNRWHVFEPSLRDEARERFRLVAELELAQQRNQLTLHYQPKYDLRTGDIVGVEALIRWQHPSRGLVAPREFIPVAEESDLMGDIGSWTIEQSCRFVGALRHEGLISATFELCVNVSPRHLTVDGFVDQLTRSLATGPLLPHQLVVELTESILIDTTAAPILRQVKELGVRVALDDFGTGYSSMGYLRSFSVDVLKIDQSFIAAIDHDPQGEAIVKAIIDLAKALRLITVAEGIENATQTRRLRDWGCDCGQGYHLSEPLTEAELIRLLASRHQPQMQRSTPRLHTG